MINHNNRASISVPVGALSGSEVLPLSYAHKKLKLINASFIQEGAISASGTNYLGLQLKKNDVAVENAVDTQAGLAARTALDLEVGEEGLILELGDYLSLDVVENGTFSEGTDGIIVLDVEVIGN